MGRKAKNNSYYTWHYWSEAKHIIRQIDKMKFYSRKDITSNCVFYKVKGQKLRFVCVDSVGKIRFGSSESISTKTKTKLKYIEIIGKSSLGSTNLGIVSLYKIQDFYDSLEDCPDHVIDEFLFNIDFFRKHMM